MNSDLPDPVLVIGDLNADLTLHVPVYPFEGDDSTATAMAWHAGGAGLNAACTFALLGAYTYLGTCIGDDPTAVIGLRTARIAGVDLSALVVDPAAATGICTVVVGPGGQRTFYSYRGANIACSVEALPAHLSDSCRMLYVSTYALLAAPQQHMALHMLESFAQQQRPVVLDLALPPIRSCRDLILSQLSRVWLVTMNEEELKALFPECDEARALANLLELGAELVALKRGPRGATLHSQTEHCCRLPPAVTVVDTNGCGDAFAAACAWGLARHGSFDESLELANLLGALTATRSGAADALPRRTELEKILNPALRRLLVERIVV